MKLYPVGDRLSIRTVAPRAGAWIETLRPSTMLPRPLGRPPRGGVD